MTVAMRRTSQLTQSTGSPILDQTSINTFMRWSVIRALITKVVVPITYTMQGAQL